MKIQGLAIIAIIIILPMSIILNSYSTNQIKTLDLQIQYDSKLKNATYDAIKAFQLNMSNSSTSDLADSKMRDIKASVNTFYNSLSNQFNMYGYGKEVLQNYVPAIVYTLYDGYYIYSSYNNTLDDDGFDDNASYKNGEDIYGLKPYIYYSCRYKPNSDSDFTITYSLDSYITIQGKLDRKPINKSGYLLSDVTRVETTGKYKYNGIQIDEEIGLSQNVYVEGDLPEDEDENVNIVNITDSNGEVKPVGSIKSYPCRKINGVKYYSDETNVFSIINDKRYNQSDAKTENITTNRNANKYYEDAYEFKNFINSNLTLKNLKVEDAVDSNGKKYSTLENNPYYNYGNVFGELNNTINSGTLIEDSNSNFNGHRLQVIKNSIESNLMVAIANYNNVSTSEVNFQMPKLEDTEWEQITQNVSMITFLQGLNIGGKIYNGHSIISNNVNEEFVSEDSIYILGSDSLYHRIEEKDDTGNDLSDYLNLDYSTGYFNVDFERRTGTASYKSAQKDESGNEIKDEDGNVIYDESDKTIYYYPKSELGSYKSIIDANSNSASNEQSIIDANSASNGQSISEYVKKLARENSGNGNNKEKLAQLYYTALGRERYGMYRVSNKLEEVQEDLKE